MHSVLHAGVRLGRACVALPVVGVLSNALPDAPAVIATVATTEVASVVGETALVVALAGDALLVVLMAPTFWTVYTWMMDFQADMYLRREARALACLCFAMMMAFQIVTEQP